MECGDVLFIKPSSFIGKLIVLFDPGKFSHCCIAVSSTHILETDIFTNAKIVPFHYADYETIRFKLTDAQKAEIPKIADSLINVKYDYLLILWYAIKNVFNLKKPWRLPKHEICSELTDLVLYDIGVIPELEYLSGESPNMCYAKLLTIGGDELI